MLSVAVAIGPSGRYLSVRHGLERRVFQYLSMRALGILPLIPSKSDISFAIALATHRAAYFSLFGISTALGFYHFRRTDQ